MATLYVSSVAVNGIPIGNDTTGTGSISSPYLTLDKAYTIATTGTTILLNGIQASPTDYRAATIYNFTKTGLTVDSYVPFGASLSATTTSSRVFLCNPGAGGIITIGQVIINGRNLNTACLELSTAPTSLYTVNFAGKTINPTVNGIFSSTSTSVTLFVILNLADTVNITQTGGRACVDAVRLGAGSQINIVGGTYLTDAVQYSYGVLRLKAIGAGVQLNISGAATFTHNAGTTGSAINVALDLVDIKPTITGSATITLSDPTAKAAGGGKGIVVTGSTAGLTQDMSGWSISGLTVNIDAAGGGGIWIGEDATGTSPYTNIDNKLNNGTITNCVVTGSSQSAAGGLHGIFNSCLANTIVSRCRIRTVGIGIVEKGGNNAVWYSNVIEDVTGTYILSKGSYAPTFLHNTVVMTAGFGGTGFRASRNPTPSVPSTNITFIGNLIVNNGAVGISYIATDGDVTITSIDYNGYWLASGSTTLPWNKLGVDYATFASYQAVEPNSANVDPSIHNISTRDYRLLNSSAVKGLVPANAKSPTDFNGYAIASPANMGSYLCDILGVGAPLVTFGGLTSGSLRTITGTGVTSNKLAPNNTNPSMVTGMIVGSAEIFRSDIGTFLYSVTETLDGAINSPFVTNLSLSITS